MTMKVEIATDAAATTWEDITDEMYVETARFAGTAHLGQIDTGSGFDWRDDAGTRTIPFRRRVRVTESAVAPGYVLWNGRTIADDVHRGAVLVGDAKQFDVNLQDTNADFGGIAFLGTQRPEETDVARIRYLIDNYLTGQARPSTTFGEEYFPETSPYLLIAHLYSGVQLIDWFTHITDTTGREFFLTKDYDLFYDIPSSTIYASGLSITDVSPNYTTSFPPILPDATEDATELFSGVRVRWAGGTVTVDRSAVETANDRWRTTIIDESIPHTSTAIARANTFLDEFDHVHKSFRVAVDLDDDQVDLLSWGMTLDLRSAAVGVLAPTPFRVSRLSWQKIGEHRYRADMELNYPTKFGRASKPGAPVVVGPVPFVPSAGSYQVVTKREQVSSSLTIGSGDGWVTPGVGSLLVMYHSGRSGRTPLTPTGWTQHPQGTVVANNDRGGMFYKIADGTESSITASVSAGDRHVCTIVEFPGEQWTVDDDAENTGTGTSIASGSVTPTAGKRSLIIGGVTDNTSDVIASTSTTAGWTELADLMVEATGFHPLHWVVYRVVSSASGSYNPSGTTSNSGSGWGGQTLAFITDDEPATPAQGQRVTETATGNGVTTAFTTSYAYAAGSLQVLVNGVDVTSSVTETSPSAGTFSFSSAPNNGATITIRYLGAA